MQTPSLLCLTDIITHKVTLHQYHFIKHFKRAFLSDKFVQYFFNYYDLYTFYKISDKASHHS